MFPYLWNSGIHSGIQTVIAEGDKDFTLGREKANGPAALVPHGRSYYGLLTVLQLCSPALSAIPLGVIWLQPLTATRLIHNPS